MPGFPVKGWTWLKPKTRTTRSTVKQVRDAVNRGSLQDASDRGSQDNPNWVRLKKRARQEARAPQQGWGGVSVSDFSVPSIEGGGMDPVLLQAAVAAGISPDLLKQIGNPNVGNRIPLRLANRGAQVMGPRALNDLVSSLVSGGYERQARLIAQERERMASQNAHNLAQLRGWYDQVAKAQGVAGERSAEFGRRAVESMTDATGAIVSALGGEANQGSYVAGAAGTEAVGNLQALATIQDQFNSDIAPLIQAEAAGALAREQAAGAARMKDLAMRLSEIASQRSRDEANLRFQVWQQNNAALNQRLQNELSIRQANMGIDQQRFQNRTGLAQMALAAQAAGLSAMGDAADRAVAVASQNQANAQKNADRLVRLIIEQAKEAGRNYRATQSGSKSVPKPYAATSADTKNSAYQNIIDLLGKQEMSLAQAMRVATSVVRGYGWSSKNAAVQALMVRALRDAGYDV